MNILRSNDVKRINKIIIRKALLELRSATRKELMETTGISSSSIGSLIMEMVKDEDILEESIDTSSGGRCPMRYVLNYEKYRIMCIILDREKAHLHVLDSLVNEVYNEIHLLDIEHVDLLIKDIASICKQYDVQSINISTPGIVRGDYVIQDSTEGLLEFDHFHRLKELCNLPMYIENDVKCMVRGYCTDKQIEDESVSYVYLSKEGGLGSASMSDGMLIQGCNRLAGEIGLLELAGSSANSHLRLHPKDDVVQSVLAQLVSVLVCCINPSLIVLSGVPSSYEPRIKELVEAIVSNQFTLNFAFDEANDYHILKALWTRAMEILMHDEEKK